MKKRLSFIIFCLLCSATIFAGQTANEDFWVRLDYMIRGTTPFKYEKESAEIELTKWNSEVKVVIKGDYFVSDSLELDHAIKAFNEILPELTIDWAKKQQASLIVQFSDLPDEFSFHHCNWYNSSGLKQETFLNHRFKIKQVQEGVLVIDNSLLGEQRQTNIWRSFGKMLIESNGLGINLGTETVLGGKIRNLTDYDRFFFSTIYSENFIHQYLKFIKEKYSLYDQYKYLTDKETKTNIVFTLQLIFLFLMTYFFYQLFWVKYLERITKGKFARYQFSGLIFFTPQIFVAMIFMIPELLKLQHWSVRLLPILIVGFVGFIVLLIFYFVLALFIYFIEHILFSNIYDFRQRQIVRIFSVSVVMIPFIFLIASIDRPQVLLMNILVMVLSFLLIIVIRFLYFHDQHQREIIRKHQQLKIEKLEQLQTKFQLEAIQARTNPHFLYNSLNTIVALAKQDAGKTEEFALNLSKLLRLRLKENIPPELPLTLEIEAIRLYLEIEKERFFDRLDYLIDVPENAEQLIIPTDILLNLVENSIKHGVSKQAGKGIIKIKISTTGQQITISVADNGPDFPDNPIYGTGLKSILEKLEILYPDNYEFAIFKDPNKCVEIKFQRI